VNEWTIAAVSLLPVLPACLVLPIFVQPFDGVVALQVSGTTTGAILLLLAEGIHRQAFVDLAVVFVFRSFVGSLLFARLLERRL
jgi:multisubunit Na+/H+ antiporter MnhF subunit